MTAMLSRIPTSARTGRASLLALAMASALVLGPRVAHAQSDSDRATARELGHQGQQALDAKDYKTAEDRFRRADKLVHAPTLELGLARALAGVHKFVESQETYNRIVREGVPPGAPDAFKEALEAAKAEVGSVAPHVARATINVAADSPGADVSNAAVTLDGQPINSASFGVARQVDPGDHVLKATADGFDPAEQHFTVPEGGTQTVQLTLHKNPNAPATGGTPPPPPAGGTPPGANPPGGTPPVDQPPDTAPTHPSMWPWIAFGVGGVGLLTGGITAGLALGQHSTIVHDCGGSACPPSEQSKIDGYNTMTLVSTIGFVLAGVGGATGAVLLVVHPRDADAPAAAPAAGLHVTPVIGLGTVGAVGTF